MKIGTFKISEFLIYRFRYQIGYGLVLAGLIATLAFVGLYLPGGISGAEMQAAVHSSAISLTHLNTLNVINLPYYLLQKTIFFIFGVSTLTIKLPSLILAFFAFRQHARGELFSGYRKRP